MIQARNKLTAALKMVAKLLIRFSKKEASTALPATKDLAETMIARVIAMGAAIPRVV